MPRMAETMRGALSIRPWNSARSERDSRLQAGARAYVELGPGRALADMVAGAYPGMTACSLDDCRSLQGVRAWLQRVTADG
jgi:hypothetical protein